MSQTIQQKVRPWVVLFMTGIFGVLIIGALFGWFAERWREILTAFMAIYGPILGTWNGERSALKIPGKDGCAPEVAPILPTITKKAIDIIANPFSEKGSAG